MALAYPGYPVANDPRLRVFLDVFECRSSRRRTTATAIRQRTRLSHGSIAQHLTGLRRTGMLEQVGPARLSLAGVRVLRRAGFIEAEPSTAGYTMTARGLQLLETAVS
jgi:hypothetical protein